MDVGGLGWRIGRTWWTGLATGGGGGKGDGRAMTGQKW